mgnify:CR=1 FL=1
MIIVDEAILVDEAVIANKPAIDEAIVGEAVVEENVVGA